MAMNSGPWAALSTVLKLNISRPSLCMINQPKGASNLFGLSSEELVVHRLADPNRAANSLHDAAV
ncbi:hypothetical protein HK405_001197, partial [Cladochytrium tenue]